MRWSAASRILVDIVGVLTGFSLGWWIHPPEAAFAATHAMLVIPLCALVVLGFHDGGLYRPRTTVLGLRELQSVVRRMLALSAIAFATAVAIGLPEPVYRPAIFSLFGACLTVPLVRRLARPLLSPGSGDSARRILIVGAGVEGRLVMKKIVQALGQRGSVVGFVDDFASPDSEVCCRTTQKRAEIACAPVLGSSHELPDLVRRHSITEVLFCDPRLDHDGLSEALARTNPDVRLGWLPNRRRGRVDQLETEDLAAVPLIRLHEPRTRLKLVKRAMDVILALVGLLVSMPIAALGAVAIRLDSGAPVLFRQQRIGRDGRTFTMYKFRTMKKSTNPYASATDPIEGRVTRAGRLLRRTGMDELPQLWNVLIGDMSLVGPRPEMPQIVAGYSDLERKRLLVRPGLTGLWQLSPDRKGAEIHENLEYDLYYIQHQSPIFDLLILGETVLFTAELAWSGLTDFVTSRFKPLEEEAPITPAPLVAGKTAGYVLVAMDQREELPGSEWWSACAPLTEDPQGNRPVVVLAAIGNMSRWQANIRWSQGGKNPRVRFVPYHSPSQSDSLVRRAGCVITDLPHVVRFAERAGVDHFFMPTDRPATPPSGAALEPGSSQSARKVRLPEVGTDTPAAPS